MKRVDGGEAYWLLGRAVLGDERSRGRENLGAESLIIFPYTHVMRAKYYPDFKLDKSQICSILLGNDRLARSLCFEISMAGSKHSLKAAKEPYLVLISSLWLLAPARGMK